MGYRVRDVVRIRHTEIFGVVRTVNSQGNLGIDWDDGLISPTGTVHPDDVVGIDDSETDEEARSVETW